MLSFPLGRDGKRAPVPASHQAADFTAGIMNIIANLLSCSDQTLPKEWSLNREVMRHMFCLWGSPHVDLFATRLNAKLPTFEFPMPDPQALAMKALSLPWQDLIASSAPNQDFDQAASAQHTASCDSRLACPVLVAGHLGIVHWPPQRLPVTETPLRQPQSDCFHLVTTLVVYGHKLGWGIMGTKNSNSGI